MPESKPNPSASKPGIKIKPVKDLEPDESQSQSIRGGFAGGVWKLFSDAGLKSKTMPFTGALTKLREL
jgi:hypothetical protein